MKYLLILALLVLAGCNDTPQRVAAKWYKPPHDEWIKATTTSIPTTRTVFGEDGLELETVWIDMPVPAHWQHYEAEWGFYLGTNNDVVKVDSAVYSNTLVGGFYPPLEK